MTAYLIKSAICLILLLAVYLLLLEKENMHRFKRFYLLLALVLGLTLPLLKINIPVKHESIPVFHQMDNVHILPYVADNITLQPKSSVIITSPTGLNLNDYLFVGYIAVTLILLLRFVINLSKILLKAYRNKKIPQGNLTLILIQENIIPNSFLHYIFVNEWNYLAGEMEEDMLIHETVHVQQKHSWDILFIELLKTIFWFNPVFYFYKKAIQLNHEFLADDGVINSKQDIKSYQYLLLAKAGLQSNYVLASNFNYSVTKKRLIMMGTFTSKLRAIIKGISLVPVTLALVFALCMNAEAQQTLPQETASSKTTEIKQSKDHPPVTVYRDHYDADSVFIHFREKDGTQYVKALSELSTKQRAIFAHLTKKYSITPKRTPTINQFNSWKNASTYGIWLDGKHIKNAELNNYSATDIVLYYTSKLYGAAKKGRTYSYQVDLSTAEYYKKEKERIEKTNATKTRADFYAIAQH
ncbi:M56 family metallopeptidase [Mucilaginibacter segetis]|uniref:M56 family metallopeptidase n=1 Tax=Mucilaginibacter segetis TaxID=2793071 RepID=A0A934PXM8_9SPHI|nr:M56 family metallopeptidase [Mucilaginibacter segetis]MBK0380966.1 M56 family metallopeptidase [Mucilaginibacter segetis]